MLGHRISSPLYASMVVLIVSSNLWPLLVLVLSSSSHGNSSVCDIDVTFASVALLPFTLLLFSFVARPHRSMLGVVALAVAVRKLTICLPLCHDHSTRPDNEY